MLSHTGNWIVNEYNIVSSNILREGIQKDIANTEQVIKELKKAKAALPICNTITTQKELASFIEIQFGKDARDTFLDLCSIHRKKPDYSILLEFNKVVSPDTYYTMYNRRTGFRKKKTKDGHWFPTRKVFKQKVQILQSFNNEMFSYYRNVEKLEYKEKHLASLTKNLHDLEANRDVHDKLVEKIKINRKNELEQLTATVNSENNRLKGILPRRTIAHWRELIQDGADNINAEMEICLARLFLDGNDIDQQERYMEEMNNQLRYTCVDGSCPRRKTFDIERPFTTRTWAAYDFVLAVTGKQLHELTLNEAYMVRDTAKAFRSAWPCKRWKGFPLITNLDTFNVESIMRAVQALSHSRSGRWMDGLVLRLIGTMSHQKSSFAYFSSTCKEMLQKSLTKQDIFELYY